MFFNTMPKVNDPVAHPVQACQWTGSMYTLGYILVERGTQFVEGTPHYNNWPTVYFAANQIKAQVVAWNAEFGATYRMHFEDGILNSGAEACSGEVFETEDGKMIELWPLQCGFVIEPLGANTHSITYYFEEDVDGLLGLENHKIISREEHYKARYEACVRTHGADEAQWPHWARTWVKR